MRNPVQPGPTQTRLKVATEDGYRLEMWDKYEEKGLFYQCC